jgi:hypothetical protein
MPHELRCYEYVNQPYAVVRDALHRDFAGILARATKSATKRAGVVAAHLSVDLGTLEVGTDIAIEVVRVTELPHRGGGDVPATVFELQWKAVRAAAVFPAMSAELSVYALGKEETQLELRGVYAPPLGLLGAAIDSVVGHRLAEASIHRFVADLAELLKVELRASSPVRTAHG